MTDDYHIDLEEFSLEKFRDMLITGEVLPGRKILKEKISERFEMLESMGIRNLKQLTDALRTKVKLERFSQESGLSKAYLVILRREANSYVPKPVNLKDIPGVDSEYIERLAAVGIKHTKHLFERARFKRDRAELSRLVNVPSDALLELVKLSDLARIGGVGPVFARIFLDAGIDTLEKLSNSSADEVFERTVAVNKEKGYTKVMATLKDVKLCVNTARELPKVVEH